MRQRAATLEVAGRAIALVAFGALAAGCCTKAVHLWVPHPDRDAHVAAAQQLFFRSLVYNCKPRGEVKQALDDAHAARAESAQLDLLDGLYALWSAGEELHPPSEERAILAGGRDALARYREKKPGDGRVASWLEGANFRIALLDGDEAGQRAALARLEEAHERDEHHRLFHNLTLALILFHSPAPESGCPAFDGKTARDCRAVDPPFCRGLCYLAENQQGCGPGKGCTLSVLWPHMISGFLLVTADYHLKANDLDGARKLLHAIKVVGPFAPFRYLVNDRLLRLEQYARSFRDPNYPAPDRPRMIMDTPEVACRLCHLSHEAERLSFTVEKPGL